MKTIIISFVLITMTTFSFAQITAQWKGGAPGDKNNWHNAKNWSNNRVPDEFTLVIIESLNTGHFAQPVIKEDAEVLSVALYANTNLTIETETTLIIDGTENYSEGITNLGGHVTNKGLINLINIEGYSYEDNKMIQGEGIVLVNGLVVKEEPITYQKQDDDNNQFDFIIGNYPKYSNYTTSVNTDAMGSNNSMSWINAYNDLQDAIKQTISGCLYASNPKSKQTVYGQAIY